MSLPVFLIAAILITGVAKGQTSDTSSADSVTADYFVGKWKTLLLGIPQGDTELTFTFEKKEGKLIGSMLEPKQNISAEFTDVKVTDGVLTSNVIVQGFNASLSLKKRDSVSFAGSVMEQFELVGARIR